MAPLPAFGALILPTDPIAPLALPKCVNVPKRLETRIDGESLFNHGTGVVVLTLLVLAGGGTDVSVGSTALLCATQVVGGTLFPCTE